ncbi:MAG: poly-gamma-glutamate biosynthesis protein PgsC [Myxococcota bacterium]
MISPDLVVMSIAIGIVVSLVFSEVYGLAAGGVVVPGYIALYLHRPYAVLLTLGVAAATFALVKVTSSFVILYGRRRTALAILLGFGLGAWLFRFGLEPQMLGIQTTDLTVIGYIIPGLMAIWFDRQGMVQTVASLCIAATLVRLVLLLMVGSAALGEAAW